MSRTSNRFRRARDEDGFTLIEVLVAITLFGLVASAGTAMFISALRASLMTKMDTTAKNLSQQRFEIVRNLPFHIDQVPAPAVNPPDLLDVYYVNASGSAGRGATGYVPAGATRWTADGDPATGAFYRLSVPTVPGFAQYRQLVATQFLDDSGTPFTPASTFNTQLSGSDIPPTGVVGVSVTTLWSVGQLPRVHRTYTQMTAGRPGDPTAVLQTRLTGIRLSGGLLGGQTMTAELGGVTADGAVSTTMSAAAAARTASLATSAGQAVNGAMVSAKAPPNSGSLGDSSGPQSLVVSGIGYGTFGSTQASNVSAQTSTGQPVIGSSSSPVRSELLGSGAGSRAATFSIDGPAPTRLALNGPHAYLEDAGCGSCAVVGASGYASSTQSGSAHGVSTNAAASVKGPLVLLPTTFAPNGLVRITLASSSLSCGVTRTGTGAATGTADVAYSGNLAYFAPYAPGNVNGYVNVPLSATQAVSPLTASILTNTPVAVDGAGQTLFLSDYIASWTSLDANGASGARKIAADGTTASAKVSALIGVTTVPLRDGDSNAVVGAQVGAGSCSAEDYR